MKTLFTLLLLTISMSLFAQGPRDRARPVKIARVALVPHVIYVPGEKLTTQTIDSAVYLIATGDNDNLLDSATFGYVILNRAGKRLSSGSVGMGGSDYEDWDGENRSAFDFIAIKLGLRTKP